MKIYVVVRGWDYEGGEVVLCTTEEEKALEVAEREMATGHWDRVEVQIWEDEKKQDDLLNVKWRRGRKR